MPRARPSRKWKHHSDLSDSDRSEWCFHLPGALFVNVSAVLRGSKELIPAYGSPENVSYVELILAYVSTETVQF